MRDSPTYRLYISVHGRYDCYTFIIYSVIATGVSATTILDVTFLLTIASDFMVHIFFSRFYTNHKTMFNNDVLQKLHF